MRTHPFFLFLRLSRPFFLLAGLLFYALGAGIARYLGVPLDPQQYILGQLFVSALQLSTHYLNEYFDGPADVHNPHRTPFTGGSGVLGVGKGKLPYITALLAAAVTLTAAALAAFFLSRSGTLNSAAFTIMLLGFAGAFFYSVPPLRLASSGFGELTTSILLANLVPAFAFILQSGNLHRLLPMSTFPLTALILAAFLAFELPDYASDLKSGKRTLLVRLGWRQAMRLHHFFILSAYALIGLAYMQGLPSAMALPVALTLPLGVLQIWYMRRIADGIKPNWTALTLNAVVLVSVVAYLLTYAFWTR